jgi:hypothetical protein
MTKGIKHHKCEYPKGKTNHEVPLCIHGASCLQPMAK